MRPLTPPDDQITYFGKDVTISITVPGEVVKTNGKAKGKTVKWEMPLNKLFGEAETTFSVTYKHDGAPLPKRRGRRRPRAQHRPRRRRGPRRGHFSCSGGLQPATASALAPTRAGRFLTTR